MDILFFGKLEPMDKGRNLTLHALQVVPSVFVLQMQFPLILLHRRVLLIVPAVTQLHSTIFKRYQSQFVFTEKKVGLIY